MPEQGENIEEFVRKVVHQSEGQIAFNEAHWKGMEALLDQEMPVVPPDLGAGYYLGSNVISLLTGVVFLWVVLASGRVGTHREQVFAADPDPTESLAKQSVVLPEEEKAGQVDSLSSAGVAMRSAEKKTTSSGKETEGSTEAVLVAKDKEQTAGPSSPIAQPQTAYPAESGEAKSSVIQDPLEEDGGTTVLDSDAAASNSLLMESSSQELVNDADDLDSQNSKAEKFTTPTGEDTPEVAVLLEQARTNEGPGRVGPGRVSPGREDSGREEQVEVERTSQEVFSSSGDNYLSKLGYQPLTIPPLLPAEIRRIEEEQPNGSSIAKEQNPIKQANRKGPFARISLGLSISPDLSSNKMFDYPRLGRDLGVVVDYWITPRLAISSGVFSTTKKYLVGGEAYAPPPGFWGYTTNGELPNKIDAHCAVLDIPINIKYRVWSGTRFSLSVSAGVSSYFMLKEDYRYELDGWESEWGIRNENQHLFGAGNLLIHAEHRFGRSFTVELAPFYKTPLTGYGHGDIRFHSLGALLTIRKYFQHR